VAALAPYAGDEPVAGFYKVALVPGGIEVAVRLAFVQPVVAGERQDRAPRWCAVVDGSMTTTSKDGVVELFDVDRVWPHCGKKPIPPAEYRFLLRRAYWARRDAPDHPAAHPFRPIDLNTMAPRF